MAKRDVFNEVLAKLREIKAFEKGRKTLRTHRAAPKAAPVPARDSGSEPYGVLPDTCGASVESVIADASPYPGIRSSLSARRSCSRSRSYWLWMPIQNSAELPKKRENSRAISAVMERSPRMIARTRRASTPIDLASRLPVIFNGPRNSSFRISPGCMGGSFVGVRFIGGFLDFSDSPQSPPGRHSLDTT